VRMKSRPTQAQPDLATLVGTRREKPRLDRGKSASGVKPPINLYNFSIARIHPILNFPVQGLLIKHERVCDTLALVFIIEPFWLSRLSRYWVSNVGEQLFGHFIHTNQRSFGVCWLGVHLEDIFHAANKSCIGFWWNTPLFFQLEFELVFWVSP